MIVALPTSLLITVAHRRFCVPKQMFAVSRTHVLKLFILALQQLAN
jgi:hypothetical protein